MPSATNAVHVAAATALDKVTYKSATSGVPGGPNALATPVATGTVPCNPGQHVVPGGVKVDDPAHAFVIDTYPDVGERRGRFGSATPAAPVGFTVVAICTSVTAVG
ncbi:MAG: hypothetical protein QOH72_613 [Solirubrobacteraceae bacterium]|nr:hypothetical protein [Solirubrobacteraceae bacterium]